MRRSSLLPLLFSLTACPQAHTSGPSSSPAPEAAPAPSPIVAPEASPVPPIAAPPPATSAKGAEGSPCASTAACASGLTCTVDTGACDKPPGCEPGQICPTVCYGVCAEPAASEGSGAEAGGGCKSDDDCRTFSNYCGGCACDGLLASDPDPKCKTRLVNCVMNPCRGKKVRCMEGACVLRDAEM